MVAAFPATAASAAPPTLLEQARSGDRRVFFLLLRHHDDHSPRCRPRSGPRSSWSTGRGFDNQAPAHVLGVAAGAVASRLSQARATSRARLGEKDRRELLGAMG